MDYCLFLNASQTYQHNLTFFILIVICVFLEFHQLFSQINRTHSIQHKCSAKLLYNSNKNRAQNAQIKQNIENMLTVPSEMSKFSATTNEMFNYKYAENVCANSARNAFNQRNVSRSKAIEYPYIDVIATSARYS